MKAAYKILIVLGMIFFIVGLALLVPFIANISVFKWMVAIPAFFVVLGICFMLPGIAQLVGNRMIRKYGKKRAALIYDHIEDTSVTVNNEYTINTVVHYLDDDNTECEAILATGFMRGRGEYPLGLTIDIYEYNGKIGWDKNSVRSEEIPGLSLP